MKSKKEGIKLDFSKLYEETEQPQKNDDMSVNERSEVIPTGIGIEELQREADIKTLTNKVTKEIIRDIQKNIMLASQRQSEILQGLKEGEDIYSLFLKAIDVIGLLTDENKTFRNQVRKDITEIYGYGLRQEQPLRIELEEVKQRLQKLEQSRKGIKESKKNDIEYKNLEGAINQHLRKIEELEEMIQEATKEKSKVAVQ